ncbi:MAG: hypothetical protein WB609_01455 [Candidatus Cybelea sp.]
MDTFAALQNVLQALEREHFERLRSDFQWTPELAECISGAVQFFALDNGDRSPDPLPVICAVGINYTQGPKTNAQELVHYGGTVPSVTRPTGTRRQPRFVIAAYNRNRTAWTTTPAADPPSPLRVYGSPDATGRSGMTSIAPDAIAPCHLIMTNVSPFITLMQWQEHARRTPEACKALITSYAGGHLDELFDRLGNSIDLWMGHSAIAGTRWVWPHFADFVKRKSIGEWLLCGNLNPQAHLWHGRAFRKPSHRLYEWYK